MFRTVLAFAVVGNILANTASAVVTISGQNSPSPTPALPGYQTFTLIASTDDGSQIQGFDFATQPEYGIFGPLNQLNPAGQQILFDSAFYSFVFPEFHIVDSYFKFIDSNLSIPPGYASESASHLRAVFTINSPLLTSVPFVQLVLPPLAAVQGTGLVQTVANSQTTFHSVSFQISNPIPEPAWASMLAAALIIYRGFVDRRRSAA